MYRVIFSTLCYAWLKAKLLNKSFSLCCDSTHENWRQPNWERQLLTVQAGQLGGLTQLSRPVNEPKIYKLLTPLCVFTKITKMEQQNLNCQMSALINSYNRYDSTWKSRWQISFSTVSTGLCRILLLQVKFQLEQWNVKQMVLCSPFVYLAWVSNMYCNFAKLSTRNVTT